MSDEAASGQVVGAKTGGMGREAGVAESFVYCRELTRLRAGNFYHGLKLMKDEKKKLAMYGVYAWMRVADDLADEGDDLELKKNRLEVFAKQTRWAMQGKVTGPEMDEGGYAKIWPAVGKTLRDYGVPRQPLEDMLAGQWMDQVQTRYETLGELEEYCYKVAGTVGLVSIHVWGYEGEQATCELAIKRGIALQLTNIVRDVVEDAKRGRLYVPGELLKKAGLPAEQRDAYVQWLAGGGSCGISGNQENDRVWAGVFMQTMMVLLDRAGQHYEASKELEMRLSAPSRSVCWALGAIYHELFQAIARQPVRVLRERVSLSKWRKLWIGVRATMGRPWEG